MVLVSSEISAQEATFKKYSGTKGVSTVFISKGMLSMIPIEKGKHDAYARVARKLDYIRILNCDKPALAAQIKQHSRESIKKTRYEVVMQMSEDGESTTIYRRKVKNGRYEYILIEEEKNEINIIMTIGNVSIDELKNLTKN